MNEAKITDYMNEVVYGSFPTAYSKISGVMTDIQTKVGSASAALPYAKVTANWTWSEAEFSARMTQEPTKTLYAQAAKAQTAFAAANSGYSLIISPLRSVAEQVRLWCGNSTVLQAGTALVGAADTELAKTSYPPTCNATSLAAFASFLKTYVPNPEPSNAAPGTSDHGRGVAVDFVIKQGTTTIASTDTATINQKWIQSGWAAKLQTATGTTTLKGPLQTPFEPWHWSL